MGPNYEQPVNAVASLSSGDQGFDRMEAAERSSTSIKASYPKKRVNIACEVCRQRKTRCDAVRPLCGFCAEVGATCVYRTPLASAQPSSTAENFPSTTLPNSVDKSSEVILRLERIEAILQQQATHTTRGRPRSETNSTPTETEVRALSRYDRVAQFTESSSRLFEQACPPDLRPLCDDKSEHNLEFELFHHNGSIMIQDNNDYHQPNFDLTPTSIWHLQRSFLNDVLPWCPIFDPQTCSDLIYQAAKDGFRNQNYATRLSFFILALGRISRECQHPDDIPGHFPGVQYFHAGLQVRTMCCSLQDTVRQIQGYILQTFFLLQVLRPVQSYEILRQASEKVIFLLQMPQRLQVHPDLREAIHRAFWACYLIEHELQLCLPQSSKVISDFHENIPLPMSSFDEPGIYWFVAEIALRRIVARPLDGFTWDMARPNYKPAIGLELSLQIEKWQENLPQAVAFPLDSWDVSTPISIRLLLDPHKVFLRAQYYSLQACMLWPSVVQLLSLPSPGSCREGPSADRLSLDSNIAGSQERRVIPDSSASERSRLKEATDRCLNYLILHANAVQPLFQTRHLFLIADIMGLTCMTLMLLCVYDAVELQDTLAARPETSEAIRIGWRCLKIWETNIPILKQIKKIEGIMEEKGIEFE